jgi:muconolactone D-isomerase
MLFQVQIEVRILDHVDRAAVHRLGKLEHERAAELQRSGKWQHLWRIVGRFANMSIFDVESNDELHTILESLPFYPYRRGHAAVPTSRRNMYIFMRQRSINNQPSIEKDN